MKRLYLLSGLILSVAAVSIGLNADSTDEKKRQSVYHKLDSLISWSPKTLRYTIDWPEVINILDSTKGSVIVNDYRLSDRPLLNIAALNNDFLGTKIFLAVYKANPNLFDGISYNPLMYAVEHKNIPMIKLLLRYKADPDLKNRAGVSARDWASASPNILKLFPKK